jgi:enamine deaminase RidA (YjgF/YER057c/UK114 family)
MTAPSTPFARRVVDCPGVPPAPGWSHAVAAGGLVFVAGTMATDFVDGIAHEARPDPRNPFVQEALELQSVHVLRTIGALLSAAGSDIRRDLLRVWQWAPAEYPDDTTYARGPSNWPRFVSATPYARQLKDMVGDPRRASTGIGVRQLPIPDALIAVDLIAAQPRPGLEKRAFDAPEGVPKPSAGYAPAVRYGDWVFLSGFGATDFRGDWMSPLNMGEPSLIAPEARVNPYIWLGSEIEAQTDYTLRMMGRIAEAAGSSLDLCVKADVTISHPSDFAGMDRVWRQWFKDDPPARTVVTGAQLVVKGLRVEIALTLLARESAFRKEAVHADGVSRVPGHAPHAMKAGPLLFLSTQLPIGSDGTVPPQMRRDPSMPYFRACARGQADHVLEQIEAICQAAGTSLPNVCKVHAFMDDLVHLPDVLAGWRASFPTDPPVLTAVAVGGGSPLLLPGAHVQLDAIAYVPG